jgi:hypothetical protein
VVLTGGSVREVGGRALYLSCLHEGKDSLVDELKLLRVNIEIILLRMHSLPIPSVLLVTT